MASFVQSSMLNMRGFTKNDTPSVFKKWRLGSAWELSSVSYEKGLGEGRYKIKLSPKEIEANRRQKAKQGWNTTAWKGIYSWVEIDDKVCRQKGYPSRDLQGLSFVPEQKIKHGICRLRRKGIKPRLKGRVSLRASSIDETVEDEGTDSNKEENGLERANQADAGGEASTTLLPASPFVGAKISSRIAARVASSTNGSSTPAADVPNTPSTRATPSSQGVPSLNSTKPVPQGVPVLNPKGPNASEKPAFSPKPWGSSQSFSPKPSSSQSFSPKPPISQGSPFSSPQKGANKLTGAKPSVFLNSRAGGEFKQPGPKSLMDSLRESDRSKTTRFGGPIVPTNLFDEPEKLTAEEKRFEFSFNAGQLVLIVSFLTIIGVMVGTAFVVWKVGAIHYNEY